MATERRISQQIRMVERVLHEYQQQRKIPLARFLTGFYKRNRQMGGNDRRTVSRLTYHYFRIGNAARQADISTRLAIAEFLCSEDSALVQLVLPALYPSVDKPMEEKLVLLEQQTDFRLEDVFPYQGQLSEGVDGSDFVKSLFVQPDLFIRLRRGHEAEVQKRLTEEGISYRVLGTSRLALPNGVALDRIRDLVGKYEVQDDSSQQTGTFFDAADGESWWDACAGAGGKSLLLLDSHPAINLLVSDVRTSILRNLDERFEAAGITKYRQKIIDLTKDTAVILGKEQFDGIILDAPCSGSGTWGRTPEMITSFDRDSIRQFAAVQRQAAEAVIKHLKPGKPLIYITCSVFSEENEQVIAFLQNTGLVKLERAELLQGYRHRADSMFVARLIRR